MKNRFIILRQTIVFLALCLSISRVQGQESSLQLVQKVAGKVIKDTRFEYRLVPEKDILGMQAIDFRFLSLQNGQLAFAQHHATALSDTTVHFGVSSAGRIRIWLNKTLVYSQDAKHITSNPEEIAYGRFRFNDGFSAKIKKGDNEILVSYEKSAGAPVVFLRPSEKNGDLDRAVSFNTTGPFPEWLYIGPFPAGISTALPQEAMSSYYKLNDKLYNWQSAPRKFLPELYIDSTATYQRESYADWQYSHGIMVWSILALADETKADEYLQFVKKYTGYLLQHRDYFQWQYDSLYALRGSYHRLFRQTMLDDAGAPALPFAALYLQEKDPALKQVTDPVVQYVSNKQVRLQDGTFCRPEPVAFTVWADDLFMSVPFLLRMAAATGEKKYHDDAAKQAVAFRKYLLDPATGLYKHAWFSNSGERSVAYWGRANGWVAWATAELLTWLPADHPLYGKILKGFRQHMKSLLNYQAADGMWHQLLNNPLSYEETSCTAMFSLAMARGVRKGWLDAQFREPALRGWQAVAKQITDDGIVHGICRGTEIGYDQSFYMQRKTIDNDPRGLGAVITAGIEIAVMESTGKK